MNTKLKTKSMKKQDKVLNDKKMLKDGWIEKKEFWTKKGTFGTWVWAKRKKKNALILKKEQRKPITQSASVVVFSTTPKRNV